MFGKNPIIKMDKEGDGKRLRVVKDSPFYTIQGEGPYAGWPAVFCRLNGCHLACTFCDTNFSDPADPVYDEPAISGMIHELAKKNNCGLVVLTGGEPMAQNITPMVIRLLEVGHTVQIETAGSFYRPCLDLPNVVTIVSPKTSFVDPRTSTAADAFKYIISADMVLTDDGIPVCDTQGRGRDRPLAAPPAGKMVYYSPMDEYDEEKNRANLRVVRDLALKHGRIALPQVHKVLQCVEPV